MKTEKMSFKNIKDVLSRDEMKEIMAGSGVTCSAWYNNGGYIYNTYGACSGPDAGTCATYCRNSGAFSCSCW